MTARTYLDHAATTPVIAAARDALVRGMDAAGNPNSPHAEGRNARRMLEDAREQLKDALGWRHDVIFTSGASEAVEMAGKRACVARRVYSATEHAIVPHAMGPDATVLPVGRDGIVDEDALRDALAEGPALVAIQQVNNETGVIQPLERLSALIRDAGSLLLADCAQGASKMPLPDADFIAICAHKLGGPLGVGALLVKDIATLDPCGGGQEKGYRRGTQDVPGVMAFAAAVAADPYDMERLAGLRSRLESGVRAAGGQVIGSDAPRIATIGAIGLPGGTSAAMLAQLDLAGLAVSAGSACSSGKAKASHVLAAMDVDPALASSYLRISFGPDSSEDDVDHFLDEFAGIADRLRARAA